MFHAAIDHGALSTVMGISVSIKKISNCFAPGKQRTLEWTLWLQHPTVSMHFLMQPICSQYVIDETC